MAKPESWFSFDGFRPDSTDFICDLYSMSDMYIYIIYIYILFILHIYVHILRIYNIHLFIYVYNCVYT